MNKIVERRKLFVQLNKGEYSLAYEIKSGDTLSEIAQEFFGIASKYHDLARLNNIHNPDYICTGNTLKIAVLSEQQLDKLLGMLVDYYRQSSQIHGSVAAMSFILAGLLSRDIDIDLTPLLVD